MANVIKPTVIVYRMGSLGDTVVALPVLHKIVEQFPNHQRIFLTDLPISGKAAPIDAILENTGIVHGKIGYPIGTRDPKILFHVLKQLRSYRPEALIYVGGGRKNGVKATWRDLVFFRFAGINKIIGAPIWKSLDVGKPDKDTGLIEYEADRLARCCRRLGAIDTRDPKSWDLKLTQSEIAAADWVLRTIKRPYFVINTGGKLPIQDWSEENWTTLLTLLNNHTTKSLVVIGSAEDNDRAGRLVGNWKHDYVNLCGQLAPRISAAVLKNADFFIGHDSGPLHLAAALGIHCIAMFSSNDPPGKWYPRGNHIILRNDEDVKLIPPTSVVDACRGCL